MIPHIVTKFRNTDRTLILQNHKNRHDHYGHHGHHGHHRHYGPLVAAAATAATIALSGQAHPATRTAHKTSEASASVDGQSWFTAQTISSVPTSVSYVPDPAIEQQLIHQFAAMRPGSEVMSVSVEQNFNKDGNDSHYEAHLRNGDTIAVSRSHDRSGRDAQFEVTYMGADGRTQWSADNLTDSRGPYQADLYDPNLISRARQLAAGIDDVAVTGLVQAGNRRPATENGSTYTATEVTTQTNATTISPDRQKELLAQLNRMGQGQVTSVNVAFVKGDNQNETRLVAKLQDGGSLTISADPMNRRYAVDRNDSNGKPLWTANNSAANASWGGCDFRGEYQNTLDAGLVGKVSGPAVAAVNALAGSATPMRRASLSVPH